MSRKKEVEADLVELCYVDDSVIGEYETEEEEFEDLYTVGIQPDQFADLDERAKYKGWIEKNEKFLREAYGNLNEYFKNQD